MSSSSITEKRYSNSGRRCEVCPRRRRGVSVFCAAHERKRNLYGSPHGRHLRPKEFADEKALVVAFVKKHREHVAIKAAVSWLDELLNNAAAGQPGIAASHFSRIHQHGVSAVDVLVASATLWLYSHRNPTALVDDERLDYAIGRAVLHLAPRESHVARTPRGRERRYKRIAGTTRGAVGRFLRENLGVMWIRMCDSLDAAESRREEARQTLGTPF